MNYGLQFMSISWTDGIKENEAIMIVREVHVALRQALMYLPSPTSIVTLPAVKPFGNWVLQDVEPNSTYGSTQWYIDQSYDRESGRLLGRQYLNIVLNEPFQSVTPHFDLAVTHYPLLDEVLNREVIGVDIPGRAAVLSNAPLNGVDRKYDRPIVLRRIISHYVGRVIGLPFHNHGSSCRCVDVCAMRPADTLEEWVDLAQEEFAQDCIYCDSCRRELSARIASNQLGLN